MHNTYIYLDFIFINSNICICICKMIKSNCEYISKLQQKLNKRVDTYKRDKFNTKIYTYNAKT